MANRPSRQLRFFSVLFLGAAALSACDDNHTPPLSGALRIANADSSGSSVQVSIGPLPAIGPVAFDTASGIATLPTGSYTAHVVPQASGSSAYDVGNVDINQDTLTTVFAIGSAYGPGLAASESLLPPPAGQVRMQALVDLPTASQLALVYSFSFTPVDGSGQAVGVNAGQTINLPSGKYEIELTAGPDCPAGQACPAIGEFLFDSGAQGVDIPGSNGANVFQLAAVPATSAQQSQYGSGVVLLLLDNQGGSTVLYNQPQS